MGPRLCTFGRHAVCLVAAAAGLVGLSAVATDRCARAQSASTSEGSPPSLPDTTARPAGDSTLGRAALWRQKRRAKSRRMTPPETGLFGRAKRFVSRVGGTVLPRRLILTIPQLSVAGLHPLIEELDGLGGGVLYKPPDLNASDQLVSLEATGSLDREYAAEMLLGVESHRYVGYAYGRFRHRPDEDFYGLGADSREADRAVYRLNQGIFGGLLGRSFGENALLGGHASVQLNRFGPGRGDLPGVQERFGASLPGVRRNVNYLMMGSFFELDLRDTPYQREFGHRFAPTEERLRSVSLEATRGLYLAAEVTHNIDVRHHDFDFTRFTVDMREFLPIDEELLHGFAFRQFASVTRSADGQMPFYRLQSIGGARSLRGYRSDRFRDRNVFLVNAEVRCQIWHWLDMAVFTDAGHVFRDLDTLQFADPRVGYGVGFRVKKDGQTLGRIDFARSVEGFRTTVDLGSLF